MWTGASAKATLPEQTYKSAEAGSGVVMRTYKVCEAKTWEGGREGRKEGGEGERGGGDDGGI